MTVTVSIPTRIRLDERALRDGRSELADAFSAAVGRAVSSSIKELIEPSNGALAVRLRAPEITWSGDGLATVSSATRHELEAVLAGLLSDVVSDLGLCSPRETSRARALLEAPVEGADDSRYLRPLGLYELPSYDGGVAHVPVTSSSDRLEQVAGPFRGWHRISARDQFDEYLFALSDFGIGRPTSGHQGAIFQDARGHMTIIVYSYPDEEIAFVFENVRASDIDWDDTARRWVENAVHFPPTALYHLTSLGAPGENLESVLTTFFAPVIREVMTRHRRDLMHQGPTDQEFDAAVEAQVKKRVEDESALMSGVTGLLRLQIDDHPYLLKVHGGAAQAVPEMTDVRLVQLVAPRPAAGRGRAGAGRSGRGARGAGQRTGEGAGDRPGEPGGRPEATGEAGAETKDPHAELVRGAPVGEGPSGFVETEEEGQGRLLFPPAPEGAEKVTFECSAYLGEPSTKELGTAGTGMQHVIGQIAWRLQMPECEFAGGFLLNAAEALRLRATNVGIWETTDTGSASSTPRGGGNLGHVDFIPTPSIQIQFLRHLAATVPLFTQLKEWIDIVYRERPNLIRGSWVEGNFHSWWGRFLYDLDSSMDQAVGRLFAMTCQVIFLQLLNSSHKAILDRLDDPGFPARFRRYLLPQLRTVAELLRARDILDKADLIAVALSTYQDPLNLRSAYPDVRVVNEPVRPSTASAPVPADWREATRSLVDVLRPTPPQTGASTADQYELVRGDDDSWLVRDKHGTLWRKEGLEDAIELRRGTIESIEPLVKQFVDLPEVIARFRDASAADAEPQRTLNEMLQKNEEIQGKARADLMYGFYASSVVEDTAHATLRSTNYHLIGVHQQAHELVGAFFQNDPFYSRGVEALFDERQGREELVGAILFSGLVLLSVICPPAAVALGIEIAVYQYEKAEERRDVYMALIDPEQVLSRAEVEAGLFAAKVGLVLSLIPVAQEALGEVRAALAVAERAGVEGAEEIGARALTSGERAAVHLAQVLERGIVETFAQELAKQWLISKVMEASLTPIMHLFESQPGTGPIGGLEGALRLMLERAEARHAAARGAR
jgi:hypothetical protein